MSGILLLKYSNNFGKRWILLHSKLNKYTNVTQQNQLCS